MENANVTGHFYKGNSDSCRTLYKHSDKRSSCKQQNQNKCPTEHHMFAEHWITIPLMNQIKNKQKDIDLMMKMS